MYSEEFLNNLPSNPYEAIQALCDVFFQTIEYIPEEGAIEAYIEAYAAIQAYMDATGLPYQAPKLGDNEPHEIYELIRNFISGISTENAKKVRERVLYSTREKYATVFGTSFAYQFSEGDLTRIQQLINELRDSITQSELFDASHKQRILKKLENLQSELHKKMSSLDKLWGLIGEAGVVIGKFGKDAKPLVDRIKEIAQIAWRTQARAEELPSGTTLPLLTDDKRGNN